MAEPGPEHQSMVKLVKIFPDLPAWVLATVLGAELPAYDHPMLIAADVTLVSRPDRGSSDDQDPKAESHLYNSDQAMAYCDADGKALWAVVWEPQFGWDEAKIYRWPQYAANIQADQHAPTVLLVYCPDRVLAERYRASLAEAAQQGRPSISPYFLTPDVMPLLTTAADTRKQPGMAALSAFCRRDVGTQSFTEFFPAMAEELQAAHAAGPGQAADYNDMVLGGLPGPASRSWRAFIMSTAASRFISEEYRTAVADGEARGEARGEAKGKAESLLAVLEARGVAVPEDGRSQFLACTNTDQLDEWLARAATATTISDVTGPPGQGRRWRSLRRPRK